MSPPELDQTTKHSQQKKYAKRIALVYDLASPFPKSCNNP